MKRTLVSSLALAFALSAATALAQSAQDPSKSQPSQTMSKSLIGTVSSVDQTAKSFVVKDSNGKEVTVFWNDSTRMSGDLKDGASVSLQTSEQGGRVVATSVNVQASKKPY